LYVHVLISTNLEDRSNVR